MDMTVLLVIGVVLLVIVGGLSLLQRRSVAPLPTSTRPPSPLPAVDALPSPAAPGTGRKAWHDPVLGTLTFDDDDLWSGDDELAFGAHDVCAEITAGPSGPDAEQVAVARAAITRDDVEPRARAAVREALQARGIEAPTFLAYRVHAGRAAQHRVVGSVDYASDLYAGDITVITLDEWRTLRVQLDD